MLLSRGRKVLLAAVISGLLWSLAGAALTRAAWLDEARLFWLDRLFSIRHRLGASPKPHEAVIIVAIDERTRDALAARHGIDPASRTLYRHAVAGALKALAAAKVKAAAVDLMLNAADDALDESIVRTLEGAQNQPPLDAVLAASITMTDSRRPIERFVGLADEGNIFLLPDADGRFRRVQPGVLVRRSVVIDGKSTPVDIPIFACQACRLFVGSTVNEFHSARGNPPAKPREDGGIEILGDLGAPFEMLIDFVGPPETFAALGQQVSAIDVIDGKTPPEALRGKLAMVGVTVHNLDRFSVSAGESRDPPKFQNPYDRDVLQRLRDQGIEVSLLQRGGMSGIEIHANVASQLLQHRRLRELASERPAMLQATIVLVVLGLGWLFWQNPVAGRRRVLRRLAGGGLLYLAVLIAAAGASVLLFVRAAAVLAPLELIAAWTGQAACGMAVSGMLLRRQSRSIESMFGSAVGRELMDYIHAHPQVLTASQHRTATVLFCDIRGFTPLTEKLSPDEVVALLQEHFEGLWHALARERAWVDKYVGDMVMAAWNVLEPIDDHALRGVRAAVGMKIACEAMNAQRRNRGQATVRIGIGVHSGPLVGGNIGSRERSNFTIIGDAVNLASRIEEETTGGEVLISAATYERVKEHVVARALPPVEIRGKTGRYTLYEILGLTSGPFIPGKEPPV